MLETSRLSCLFWEKSWNIWEDPRVSPPKPAAFKTMFARVPLRGLWVEHVATATWQMRPWVLVQVFAWRQAPVVFDGYHTGTVSLFFS